MRAGQSESQWDKRNGDKIKIFLYCENIRWGCSGPAVRDLNQDITVSPASPGKGLHWLCIRNDEQHQLVWVLNRHHTFYIKFCQNYGAIFRDENYFSSPVNCTFVRSHTEEKEGEMSVVWAGASRLHSWQMRFLKRRTVGRKKKNQVQFLVIWRDCWNWRLSLGNRGFQTQMDSGH